MINRETAYKLARGKIDSFQVTSGDDEIVIQDDLTIEKDFGWVFFYTFRRFLESGDPLDRPYRNAPIIVNGETGSVFATGTAKPIEGYIREFEVKISQSPLWRDGLICPKSPSVPREIVFSALSAHSAVS